MITFISYVIFLYIILLDSYMIFLTLFMCPFVHNLFIVNSFTLTWSFCRWFIYIHVEFNHMICLYSHLRFPRWLISTHRFTCDCPSRHSYIFTWFRSPRFINIYLTRLFHMIHLFSRVHFSTWFIFFHMIHLLSHVIPPPPHNSFTFYELFHIFSYFDISFSCFYFAHAILFT